MSAGRRIINALHTANAVGLPDWMCPIAEVTGGTEMCHHQFGAEPEPVRECDNWREYKCTRCGAVFHFETWD